MGPDIIFGARPGFAWVGGPDRMVGQGGTDHARYRVLSVPVGPVLAVDREPSEPGYHWAARRCVGRAPGGCGVGVPALYQVTPVVKNERHESQPHAADC
jgi:hypothetical protein